MGGRYGGGILDIFRPQITAFTPSMDENKPSRYVAPNRRNPATRV
jgi:hypothetical protein